MYSLTFHPMTKNSHSRLIQFCVVSGLLVLTPLSHASTTLLSPSKYLVNEGVAFSIGNSGTAGFLFSWTDSTGVFSGESDPTLVLEIGQTYTFQRTATGHPFAIMDNSASTFIAGSDGAYARTFPVGTPAADMTTAINAATLAPIADFTAAPAPTPPAVNTDFITWMPNQVGDYWYTCTVTGHANMTGKITIVPEPSVVGLIAGGVAFAAFRRRRSGGRATE